MDKWINKMLFINIMEHCSNLERMESCSGLNEEFEHLVHSGGSVLREL